MSGFKYVEDPILGKGRAEFNVGGGGGGGGTDYVFSNEFTVAGDTVSIASVSASKITGKVGSAGVADALIDGATVANATKLGGATKQQVIDSAVASASGGGNYAAGSGINSTALAGGTIAVGSTLLNQSARLEGHAVFSNSAATLAANTPLVAVERCDNEKNDYITFYGEFSTFDTLKVSHCSTATNAYVLITDTAVQIYTAMGELVVSYAHGLTLSTFIHVIVHANDDATSDVSIMTSDGSFKVESVPLYSTTHAVQAVSTTAMTNCEINYIVNDTLQDVWIFGDSFLELNLAARWPYQFVANGHKNVLFCGVGGATSMNEIISFRALIALARPKYLCWFLGMNDADDGAINADYKTCLDEVIATCTAYGVTPIIGLTPNTSGRDNTYKNTYVKSLGVRYVDFAGAVGASTYPSAWYSGMRSGDGVHPSELGAKALYQQFVLDVPESVYSERGGGTEYTGGFGIKIDHREISQDVYFPIETVTDSSVTLRPGHGYDVYAVNSTVTLNTETVPLDKFGLDGDLKIYLDSMGNIATGANVVLTNALSPNTVNNCVVRFRDGRAIIRVVDNIGGYIVNVASGTSEGSLQYGISLPMSNYITFNDILAGQPIDMGGVVTSGEKYIVGNGTSDIILTGAVSCTSTTVFMNLAMSGAIIAGGTPSLSGVYIPNGGSIARSGGQFQFDNVGGPGFVDMGGSNYSMPVGASAYISGCTITNPVQSPDANGGFIALNDSNTVKLENITLTGATVKRGALCFLPLNKPSNVVELTGCTIASNQANTGGCINASAGKIYATSCYFEKNTVYEFSLNGGAELFIKDCVFSSGYQGTGMGFTGNLGYVTLTGSNFFGNGTLVSGGIVISSGASLGITGALSAGAGSNIEVRGGTCMVNGVIVESGFYNKIASSGGSAVAQ